MGEARSPVQRKGGACRVRAAVGRACPPDPGLRRSARPKPPPRRWRGQLRQGREHGSRVAPRQRQRFSLAGPAHSITEALAQLCTYERAQRRRRVQAGCTAGVAAALQSRRNAPARSDSTLSSSPSVSAMRSTPRERVPSPQRATSCMAATEAVSGPAACAQRTYPSSSEANTRSTGPPPAAAIAPNNADVGQRAWRALAGAGACRQDFAMAKHVRSTRAAARAVALA